MKANAGGYTWAFNTQLYIEQYYPDFNPGWWVAMDSIVGGRLGIIFKVTCGYIYIYIFVERKI